METRGRTSRAEWQKRIERWNDSGLSAEQFAAEMGINAGTLRHWKYFLAKPASGAATAKPVSTAAATDLVEVRPLLQRRRRSSSSSVLTASCAFRPNSTQAPSSGC